MPLGAEIMNLPEEFSEYAMAEDKMPSHFLELRLLKALSDARDELHDKDCIIGVLLQEKKILKEHLEMERYEKHTWKATFLKKHGIEPSEFIPIDKLYRRGI